MVINCGMYLVWAMSIKMRACWSIASSKKDVHEIKKLLNFRTEIS